MKTAGVLTVIWSGFLASTHAFSKGNSTIFRKHTPWGIGTDGLGMMGCIFAENGPLKSGIEVIFSWTGWGAKGDFRWIFGLYPWIFEGVPSPLSREHVSWDVGIESLGMTGYIYAENGALEGGIGSSLNGTVRGGKGDFIRYSYL